MCEINVRKAKLYVDQHQGSLATPCRMDFFELWRCEDKSTLRSAGKYVSLLPTDAITAFVACLLADNARVWADTVRKNSAIDPAWYSDAEGGSKHAGEPFTHRTIRAVAALAVAYPCDIVTTIWKGARNAPNIIPEAYAGQTLQLRVTAAIKLHHVFRLTQGNVEIALERRWMSWPPRLRRADELYAEAEDDCFGTKEFHLTNSHIVTQAAASRMVVILLDDLGRSNISTLLAEARNRLLDPRCNPLAWKRLFRALWRVRPERRPEVFKYIFRMMAGAPFYHPHLLLGALRRTLGREFSLQQAVAGIKWASDDQYVLTRSRMYGGDIYTCWRMWDGLDPENSALVERYAARIVDAPRIRMLPPGFARLSLPEAYAAIRHCKLPRTRCIRTWRADDATTWGPLFLLAVWVRNSRQVISRQALDECCGAGNVPLLLALAATVDAMLAGCAVN